MDQDQQQKNSKPQNLENLSREELVNKCKNLLLISKKAKTAKDDLAVEMEKIKNEQAKVIRTLEDERNKAEQQTEVLQEMVSNLSENKISLVTKNESTLRQLNMLQSEVDAMKTFEKSIVEEKQKNSKENEKLKIALDKQQDIIEQMRDERKQIQESGNQAWTEVKTKLMDEIDSLKAQLGQVDNLKQECKKLLAEKNESVKELNELKQNKKIKFEGETKALEDLCNQLKAEKIIMEEKYHSSQHEIDIIKKQMTENGHKLEEKLLTAEKSLIETKIQLDESNKFQAEMEKNIKKLVEEMNIKIKELEHLEKEHSSLIAVNETLKNDRQICDNATNERKSELTDMQRKITSYQYQISALQDKIKDLEQNALSLAENAEHKIMYDQLESEFTSQKETLVELSKENNDLKIFYNKIGELFGEGIDLNNPDNVVQLIHDLKINHSEMTHDFEKLKIDSGKLANLAINLIHKLPSGNKPDDVDGDISKACEVLEDMFKLIQDTKLDEMISLSNTELGKFMKEVCKLDEIFENFDDNGIFSKIAECLTQDLISNPLNNLIFNFSSICFTISRIFNYELSLDYLSKNCEFEEKTKTINSLMLKLVNFKLHSQESYLELQKMYDENTKKLDTLNLQLEEKNQVIQSNEEDLEMLKVEYNELQKVTNTRQNDVEDFRRNIDQLNFTLKQKENELLAYKGENDDFNKEMKTYEDLKVDFKELSDKIASFEDQLSKSNRDKESMIIEIKEMTESNILLKEENEALGNQLTVLRKEISDSEADNSLQINNENLKKELENLINENTKLRDEMTVKKTEYDKIKLELELNCKEYENIKTEYESVKEELLSTIHEKERIESELQEYENIKTDYESLKEELESKIHEIERIESELQEYESIKTEYESVKEELESKIHEYERIESELQLQISEFEDLRNKTHQEYESLKEELESKICEHERIESELQSRIIEFKDLSETHQAVESKYNELKESNETLIQESEKMKCDFASLKKEADIMQIKISSIESDTKMSQTQTEENEVLEEDLNSVQDRNESLISKIRSLESEHEKALEIKELKEKEISRLTGELENEKVDKELLINKMTSMENEIKEYSECNKTVTNERETIKEELEQFKNDNEGLTNKISELDNIKESIQSKKLIGSEYEKIKEESELTKMKIESYGNDINSLEDEVKKSLEDKEQLRELYEEIKNELAQARQENEVLKNDVQTLEANVIGCVKSYKSIHESCLKTEDRKVGLDAGHNIEVEDIGKIASDDNVSRNNEIIAELNEMNEVIRARGEKISILEDSIRQKEGEIDTLKSQLLEAENKLSKDVINQQPNDPQEESSIPEQNFVSISESPREEKRKTSETDVPKPQTMVSAHPDTHSEVASTSTFSRIDDTHRMKDLEDTFEERYMKLKNLAIKLKKKLLDQTTEMKTLEETKNRLLAEKEQWNKNKGEILSPKNIQALQSEIDKLQDDLELISKEKKELEKLLLKSAQDCADFKSKYTSLQEENSTLNMKVKNLDESVLGHKGENIKLQNQVSILGKKLEEEEEKINKRREEQKNLEAKLESERKNRQSLIKDLDEAKFESKKNTLLDLEVQDYERSVEDLTNQLKEKEDQVSELKSAVENRNAKIGSLSEEICLLKEQVENEADRAEKLKVTVDDYMGKLNELRSSQESYLSDKCKDKSTIEILKQESENVKLELSIISSQSSKVEVKLKREKEAAEAQLEMMENRLKEREQNASELRSELDALKSEFEAYKLRAQSVLRQKAKVPQENIEDLKQEKELLNGDLEAARIKVFQIQSELSTAKTEIGYLSSEKERISVQLTAVSKEVLEKETSLKTNVSSLQKKLEAKTTEYQLAIANLTAQSDAMDKNFKLQLDSQKEKFSRQIQDLESKLEVSEEKIWQLKNSPSFLNAPASISKGGDRPHDQRSPRETSAVHHTGLPPSHARTPSGVGLPCDDQRVDISNMVREDGEGSEWVEPHNSYSPSQQLYHPPPLDHLISNPFPEQQRQSTDDLLSTYSAGTDYVSKEIGRLESKLSGSDLRNQQLTTLLSESEAENAKLAQLTEALKEDIRRTSRNESREKHLENNEYIKNVILKFVSLQSGDEKFRLIPVLKTLLQLSPEEASKLTVIAKGDDSANSAQGWGGYLHLWSGR